MTTRRKTFGVVSPRERLEADRFFADLTGAPRSRVTRSGRGRARGEAWDPAGGLQAESWPASAPVWPASESGETLLVHVRGQRFTRRQPYMLVHPAIARGTGDGNASSVTLQAEPYPAATGTFSWSANSRAVSLSSTTAPEIVVTAQDNRGRSRHPGDVRVSCTFTPRGGGSPVTTAFPMTVGYPMGIDVSYAQGTLSREIWQALSDAGFLFGIAKSSEGDEGVGRFDDVQFANNYRLIKEATIIRGAYHFARFRGEGNRSDDASIAANARAQATSYWQLLSRASGGSLGPGDLPPILDAEGHSRPGRDLTGKEHQAKWTLAFLRRVRELSNKTPILYTGYHFFRAFPAALQREISNTSLLWEARYRSSSRADSWPGPTTATADDRKPDRVHNGQPGKIARDLANVPGWPKWTMWQWSGNATTPAIPPRRGRPVRVDLNFFNGTLAELRTLAGL